MIFDQVDDYAIFRHYVPDFTDSVLKGNQNITSVFNPDENNPSMSVYRGVKGAINYKCFSTSNQGDCFQLVADLKGMDNRTQFDKVLESIVDDMRLNVIRKKTFESDDWKSEYYDQFTKAAIGYWDSFNVDQKTLSYFRVRQLKRLTYKNKKGKTSKYDYEAKNLMAFEFDISGRKKLYVPVQKGLEEKYVAKNQRSSDIFGLKELPSYKVPYILICEGEKDCLVANAHGITAVSFQSASTVVSRSMIRELLQHAHYLIVCYDNDGPGRKNSYKLCKDYLLVNYELPEKYNDLADYLPNADANDFKKLLSESIKEYRKQHNYKIWVHDSCYYKYQLKRNGEDESKPIAISNFTLEVDAMIFRNDESSRLVRFIGEHYSSPTLAVPSTIFNSEVKLADYLLNIRGNFHFHGSKSDLQEITMRVFHMTDYLDEIRQLGWDYSREQFVLGNGVIKGGRFYRPDPNGIYKDILIPTASKNYKDKGYSTSYTYETGSGLKLKEWISYMIDSWNDIVGITSFAYVLASVNFDWIKHKFGHNFPMFNIDGQARTGKGSLVPMLLAPFTSYYSPNALPNGTANYFTRLMAQTPNIPVWLDEFKTSQDPRKSKTIKNFYDLTGKGKAEKTTGLETSKSPILSSVIITGEDAPVHDEGYYTRLIYLTLPKVERSDTDMIEFSKKQINYQMGCSHILEEMLSWRDYIIEHYDENYNELLKYFSEFLAEQKIKPDTRIIKNYCKIFSPILVMAKREDSDIGLSIKKVMVTAYKVMADHTINQKTVDDTGVFWKLFIQMATLQFNNPSRIRDTYDFKFDSNSNRLFVRSAVFDRAAKFHLLQYQRAMKDPASVIKYMTSTKAFIGRDKKPYFQIDADSKPKQLRALEFDLTLLPEHVRDFFNEEETDDMGFKK